MSVRNVLIVHDSKVIRNRLKYYVLTEFDSVAVSEGASGEEAVQKCKEQRFEVVLCGKEISGVSGIALYKKMQALAIIPEGSFIFLTATGTPENIKEFIEQGIAHYMVFPFTARELRDKINLVCDPRRLRIYERTYIPDTKVIIHSKYEDIDADVVNLSANGVSCDVVYSNDQHHFFGSTRITIQFPAEYNSVRVENVACKILRLHIMTWKNDGTPEHVHAAWQLLGLSAQNRKVIEEVLEESRKGFG
jgi:DNA-binding response OmpR family regulator